MKYAFELFGKTFEPFSCSVTHKTIKELFFEKADPDNHSDSTFWMTFNFGPISSLEEAQNISDSIKEQILDKLSFELGVKIEKARLIEHNVNPRPGEGMHFNIILPALQVHGTISSEPRKLVATEIVKIQEIVKKEANDKQNTLLKLYRHALNIDDIGAQFLMLYLILDIMTAKNDQSNQTDIDNLILSIDPSTPQSPHPLKRNSLETIYTKLRNEMIHREFDHQGATVDHATTRDEMLNWIDKFRKIVKAAILKNMA